MIANSEMRRLIEHRDGAAEVGVPSRFRHLVAGGFKVVEGCFFLATLFDHDHASSLGWYGDATGYECAVNAVHLEDYLPPGAARESSAMALTGESTAHFLAKELATFARSVTSRAVFRTIVTVSGQTATIRFHAIRDGESWLNENLEGYQEAVLVLDTDECDAEQGTTRS